MGFRVKALIEYDGSGYAGFQVQPGRPTIQGEIEAALLRLTGEQVRILGAGRTDAGVHAEGQVIAFDTEWRHPLSHMQRGLNALLPRAIAVKELAPAPAGFHPRFDARSRRYRYRILNQPIRSPLNERYAWHVPRALDVQAMQAATRCLVGIHDFATFGQPTQGEATVREVMEVTWRCSGRLIQVEIEANAYLRNMVRCIVGSALQVGTGDCSVEAFRERFQARDRSQSGPPAPPHGLCLVKVCY